MDFRFQQAVDNLIGSQELKPGDFDRLSVAGGAGNFGELQKHLQLAQKLHGVKQAILMTHEDCGAGATRDDLARAAAIAKKHDLQPKAFYLKLDGTLDAITV